MIDEARKQELDKYLVKEQNPADYFNEQILRGDFRYNTFWITHIDPTRSVHAAKGWKFHIHADSDEDWQKIASVLIPYLKDVDVDFKMFIAPYPHPAFQSRKEEFYNKDENQYGKSFVIYPSSIKEFEKVAQEMYYILENNNLNSHQGFIHGDNQIGDHGRIFYRNDWIGPNNPGYRANADAEIPTYKAEGIEDPFLNVLGYPNDNTNADRAAGTHGPKKLVENRLAKLREAEEKIAREQAELEESKKLQDNEKATENTAKPEKVTEADIDELVKMYDELEESKKLQDNEKATENTAKPEKVTEADIDELVKMYDELEESKKLPEVNVKNGKPREKSRPNAAEIQNSPTLNEAIRFANTKKAKKNATIDQIVANYETLKQKDIPAGKRRTVAKEMEQLRALASIKMNEAIMNLARLKKSNQAPTAEEITNLNKLIASFDDKEVGAYMPGIRRLSSLLKETQPLDEEIMDSGDEKEISPDIRHYSKDDLQKIISTFKGMVERNDGNGSSFASLFEYSEQDLKDFNEGKLAIAPDAHEAMKEFIDIFATDSKGNLSEDGKKALNKLENSAPKDRGEPVLEDIKSDEKVVEPAVKEPIIPETTVAPTLNASASQPKAYVKKSPAKKSLWQRLKDGIKKTPKWIKRLAIGIATLSAVALGMQKCGNDNEKDKPDNNVKTEIKSQPQKTNGKTEIKSQPKNKAASFKQDSSSKQDDLLILHADEIEKAYYDSAIKMQIGEEKRDALYRAIEKRVTEGKLDVGAFSVERTAHAIVMYQKIQPNNKINQLFNKVLSGEEITKSDNTRIKKYIQDAGEYGDGIKGKGTHNQFEKAPRQQQIEHIHAVKAMHER